MKLKIAGEKNDERVGVLELVRDGNQVQLITRWEGNSTYNVLFTFFEGGAIVSHPSHGSGFERDHAGYPQIHKKEL